MSGYIGSKASVTQVDGYNRTEADAEFVQDPNGAITVSGSNVGIGTSSPSNTLHVVGRGTLTRGLELGVGGVNASNYISQYRSSVETIMGPATTRMLFGTVSDHDIAIQTNNTERMRIDSAGRVTTPYQPAFNAKANAGTAYNTTGWNKLSIGTLMNQRGSHYSTSTSRFTAPVSGWYCFSMSVVFYDGNDVDGAISLAVNGVASGNGIGVNSPSTYGNFSGRSTSGSVYLSSGDYAEVYVYLTVAMTTRADPYSGYFSGHLIG